MFSKTTLREKCPFSKLFWSAFSRILTEYEEILCISPYSVHMRENADQNNSKYGHLLLSATSSCENFIHHNLVSQYSWHILQFHFKKSSFDLGLKNLGLPYWARISFIIYWTWNWNVLELPSRLGLNLWYIRVRLEKYSNLTGFRLILWYVGLGRKKYLD